MASEEPPTTVGGTVTEGIIDITALLPLLGTEQVEKHIGSALDGGYIYAAAAPLSIFGALGIIKATLSILVSSISVPIPPICITWTPYPRLVSVSRMDHILGARILDNAGFKHVGSVSPLIGLDDAPVHAGTFSERRQMFNSDDSHWHDKRYKAETCLLEVLEQKHIEDLDGVRLECRSWGWNIKLIISTFAFAVVSIIPYIHLIALPTKPAAVRQGWTFPFMRALGSTIATVCYQLLIQFRIYRLMQARLNFQVLDKYLLKVLETRNSAPLDSRSLLRRHPDLSWNGDRPAEESLSRLMKFIRMPSRGEEQGLDSMFDFTQIEKDGIEQLFAQGSTHGWHQGLFLVTWLCLLLAIPLVITGYIGSLTLVKSSKGEGRDPLMWLGLEIALAVTRVILWAINPGFDEETDMTIQLRLDKTFPMLSTDKGVLPCDSNQSYSHDSRNPLPRIVGGALDLVAEQDFLQRITPFTGPLDEFHCPENKRLFFTMSGRVWDCEELHRNGDGKSIPEGDSSNVVSLELFITLFDIVTRKAFVVHGSPWYPLSVYNAIVNCDPTTGNMEAILQGVAQRDRSLVEFYDLAHLCDYYRFTMQRLRGSHSTPICIRRKWNFQPKTGPLDEKNDILKGNIPSSYPQVSEAQHRLLLNRGCEQALKTALIDHWGQMLVRALRVIADEMRCDCFNALAEPRTDEGRVELLMAGSLLELEWGFREMNILRLSCQLEDLLQQRVETYIDSMASHMGANASGHVLRNFRTGQRKRLQQEMGEMTKRLREMESHIAETTDGLMNNSDSGMVRRIENAWLTVIANAGKQSLSLSQFNLEDRTSQVASAFEDPRLRNIAISVLRRSKMRWSPQRDKETEALQGDVDRICQSGPSPVDYGNAYANCFATNPDPDNIYRRFVECGRTGFDALKSRSSNARRVKRIAELSDAAVYSVHGLDVATIRHIIDNTLPRTAPLQLIQRALINVSQSDLSDVAASVDSGTVMVVSSSPPTNVTEVVRKTQQQWWINAEDRSEWGNSYASYFTPDQIEPGRRYVLRHAGVICRVLVFVACPGILRLYLVHIREGPISVAIRCIMIDMDGTGGDAGSKEKHEMYIELQEIPEKRLELGHPCEIGPLHSRKYEIEVEVINHGGGTGFYGLRDVFIEFPVEGGLLR